MLFSWITQFGLATRETRSLLGDLHQRAFNLGSDRRPFEHHLIATLGSTDIVEIARFNHHFFFGEVAESSAQSFRHSVGARCPRSLKGDLHPKVHLLDEVLKRNPAAPLMAVVYLKVSPIAKLFLPRLPVPRGLGGTVFKGVFKKTSLLWSHYNDEIYDFDPREPPMVAPLLGMDSPEMILVARARRLEQIAALIFALRRLRLEDLWATSDHEGREAVRRIGELLPDVEDAAASWSSDPLFVDTTTLVGFLLVTDQDRSGVSAAEVEWELEAFDRDQVAGSGALLSHFTVHPGASSDLMSYPGIAAPKLAPPRMMFGPTDVIQALPSRDGASIRLGELIDPIDIMKDAPAGLPRRFFRSTFVTLDFPGGPPDARPSSTTVQPLDDLLAALQNALIDERRRRFDRNRDDSFLKRWLAAAKRSGQAYSTTDDFINTVRAALSYLYLEVEPFADLLPILNHIPRHLASVNSATPREIGWLCGGLETMLLDRARQSYLNHKGGVGGLLEGMAGYTRSRDAFAALVEVLAEHLAPRSKGKILILHSASGGISCEYGPAGWTRIRISRLSLSYPMHWTVAHDLAVGRLRHLGLEELDPEGRLDALRQELRLGPTESVSELFLNLFKAVKKATPSGAHWMFGRAVEVALSKAFGDLALLMSLARQDDPSLEAARRRFYFVHGPRIVVSVKSLVGNAPPDMATIAAIVVRCTFVYLVLQRLEGDAGASRPWWESFTEVLDRLEGLAGSSLQSPSAPRMGKDPLGDVVTCLHVLQIDLGLPQLKWTLVLRKLRQTLTYLRSTRPRVLTAIGGTLELARQACEVFRLPAEGAVREVAEAYAGYLSELMKAWRMEADPWPPVIQGHGARQVPSARKRSANVVYPAPAVSARGGVFVEVRLAEDDPREGQTHYHARTSWLVVELAEHVRRLRYEKLRGFLKGSEGSQAP